MLPLEQALSRQSIALENAKCKIQTAFTTLFTKLRGTSGIDASRPCVILGESYSTTTEQRLALEKRCKALLYFSYRTNLPVALANSGYTSDCGWGCLLRSVQMLVAESLLRLLRLRCRTSDVTAWERRIIEMFADDADSFEASPFSMSALLHIATTNYSKRVGEQFGPCLVVQLVDSACRRMEAASPTAAGHEARRILESFSVYTARDATIFWPDVLAQLTTARIRNQAHADADADTNTANQIEDEWIGCLLLVPLRLGADSSLDARYARWLRFALDSTSCVGFVGGRRPHHGVFVCGYQLDDSDTSSGGEAGGKLLAGGLVGRSPNKFVGSNTSSSSGLALQFVCLDPHNVQRVVPIRSASAVERDRFCTDSYHVSATHSAALDTIRASKMDSSLAMGFFIQIPASVVHGNLTTDTDGAMPSRESIDAFVNCDAVVHFQAEIDRIMQHTSDEESRRLSITTARARSSAAASASHSRPVSSPSKRLLPLISFSEQHFAQATDWPASNSTLSLNNQAQTAKSGAGRSESQKDTLDGDFVLL